MKIINDQTPALGTLPDNYQEVLYWTITGKPMRVIAMNILGVFLFVIFGLIFAWLAYNLGKLPLGNFKLGLGEAGLVLAGSLLTIVLHELTHGLAMQMSGAKPQYGFLWQGMFYATSPGYAYPRNNYVVTALAPFAFLSTLFVLGMWLLQGTLWVALLGICGAINAAGVIGDLWMTMIVLRYAPTALVVDERDGIRVFLPKSFDEKIKFPTDGMHFDDLKIEDVQHRLVKEHPGG